MGGATVPGDSPLLLRRGFPPLPGKTLRSRAERPEPRSQSRYRPTIRIYIALARCNAFPWHIPSDRSHESNYTSRGQTPAGTQLYAIRENFVQPRIEFKFDSQFRGIGRIFAHAPTYQSRCVTRLLCDMGKAYRRAACEMLFSGG